MNTPIVDFVKKYSDKKMIRAHMPGHKGEKILGFEHLDITEIKGADTLFECDSIIKESEKNASEIFHSHTFYSTEGSSLCIRAMLHLTMLYAKKYRKNPLVLACRNVHKTFLSAVALNDLDVEWIYGDSESYLSSEISANALDEKLCEMAVKPVAFYCTSPDYLGNVADIKALSLVCKKHDVLFLVDNAHGAYLKFLNISAHPIDLGADMCCDSAHKTLPVLTGGAYLHINCDADGFLVENTKRAMALFASTSPSYLILQSLDMCNSYLCDGYRERLQEFSQKVEKLKTELLDCGYALCSKEQLKVTIATKSYGYTGTEFAQLLRENHIECEFCDPDFVVLMLTPSMSDIELEKIKSAFISIKKKAPILSSPPKLKKPEKVLSIKEAVMSLSHTVKVENSISKVLSDTSLSCPPAVPILVCGERVDESAVECFKYYSITECEVISE